MKVMRLFAHLFQSSNFYMKMLSLGCTFPMLQEDRGRNLDDATGDGIDCGCKGELFVVAVLCLLPDEIHPARISVTEPLANLSVTVLR